MTPTPEGRALVDKLRGLAGALKQRRYPDNAALVTEAAAALAAMQQPGDGADRFEPEIVADPYKPYIHMRLEPAGRWMVYADHAAQLAAKDEHASELRDLLDAAKAERDAAERDADALEKDCDSHLQAALAAEQRADAAMGLLREYRNAPEDGGRTCSAIEESIDAFLAGGAAEVTK